MYSLNRVVAFSVVWGIFLSQVVSEALVLLWVRKWAMSKIQVTLAVAEGPHEVCMGLRWARSKFVGGLHEFVVRTDTLNRLY